MLRFVHTVILGLIAAGVIHLAILFMLPDHAVRDAWGRISDAAGYYETVQLTGSGSGSPLLESGNPFIEMAACRFNLEDGMLQVSAEGEVPFWSLAIYDERSQNTFSVSDRVSEGGALDAVLLTPLQMQRLKSDPATDISRSLFLETGVIDGFVLIRAFVPDDTWQAKVRTFLSGIQCESVALP